MRKQVLIVDDDQEMLLALKEGLDKYSDTFTVSMAGDGMIAAEKLKREPVSLVVTDLKMPRMDGFALLAHVMEHYPDVPVIVITAYSTPEMHRLAKKGGAVGYIAKPFMMDELAKIVLTTLRRESEGGTLHSVSSGMFLQLMEMEQKTCTIRLVNKTAQRKGVLFFKDGELLEARVNGTRGLPAAYEIFSWEEVTLSIQNVCPQKKNMINSELQPIILEAMRIKDEAQESDGDISDDDQGERPDEDLAGGSVELPPAMIKRIRQTLENRIGHRCGVEDIYIDETWDHLQNIVAKLGVFFLILGFSNWLI